jgi:CRP-like cAMP-binding protein
VGAENQAINKQPLPIVPILTAVMFTLAATFWPIESLSEPRGFRVFEAACDMHHIATTDRVRVSESDQPITVRLAVRSGSGERGPTVKQNSFAADRKLFEALENHSQSISCNEGRVLFRQGEAPTGLYIIQSGEATLMRESPTGRAIICLSAGPGSLLGLPGLVANEPFTLTAMVRKGTTVRFVNRNDFEDLMRSEPSLNLSVLQVLAAEVRSARLAVSSI